MIQKQIRNCTDAISEGRRYPSLMEKLDELEQDLADAKSKLANSAPRNIRLQLRDTRRFVEMRLRNLQSLLNGEPRLARAEIIKHVQKITMTPEGRTYIASGSWDLLGSVAVTMVPGARHAPRVRSNFKCLWRRDNGQSSKIASAATRAARPSSRPASAGGTTRSSLTTAEDQRSFTASSLPSNTQNCSSG